MRAAENLGRFRALALAEAFRQLRLIPLPT